MKKPLLKSKKSRRMLPYAPIFLFPVGIAFFIGFIWPFAQGIYLSFCKFITADNATFIGTSNYARALSDPAFRYSFIYTAVFATVSVVVINVLAFAVAYALTQKIRGRNIFRSVFFMPNLIGGIVLGYIWSMIFDAILRAYGTYLLAKASYGFVGLLILMSWQQIGYMMIIYIAGLQSVPESFVEAAKIDGASRWQILRRVIIPNVMPSITICTFLTLTNSFKLFDQNLALTAGMPVVMENGVSLSKTEMLALNIYKTFYTGAGGRGVAQAKAVIFFILVAVIALLQLSATRKKEVQQ